MTITGHDLFGGTTLRGVEPRLEGGEPVADQRLAAVGGSGPQPSDPAAGIFRPAVPLERHGPEVELRGAVAELREPLELLVRRHVAAGVVIGERGAEIGVRRDGDRQCARA